MKNTSIKVAVCSSLLFGAAAMATAQTEPIRNQPLVISSLKGPDALQPLPSQLPAWMHNRQYNEVFYRRGKYNFDIYNVDAMARDFNAIAVGHAFAYEDLVNGRGRELETKTFDRIDWVLKHPPKNMPGEKFLSPKFARTYSALEQVFDWTHVLHGQTIDVLASTDLTQAEKEAEIERLWRYYKDEAPYTVSGLPMNMALLDSQAYSQAFRTQYPKVNGLFWGYHWLQGAVYDMLWTSRSLNDRRQQYTIVGKRYRDVELFRTDRAFMPMFAETSPLFARRFPHIANAFDNLHMLHDMVNDILASDWMTERQKAEQINRAIWMVSDAAHPGESAGDFKGADALHDHRYMDSQPGMGMMRMSTPEQMFMPDMGWMSMAECAHCSMPMNNDPKRGSGASVSAEGWTMEVRCVLCARDMAAQVEGQAIIRANTEDPNRPLILLSDEEGNYQSNLADVVFLEVEGSHPTCNSWSRAFTSRAAFEAYLKANADDEELAGAVPLSLAEWSARNGGEPSTYEKRTGPVDDPYAGLRPGGKS